MKILIISFVVFLLYGCNNNTEKCNQYNQIEASMLSSRNSIYSMNREHSSDATQLALRNADDALDELQKKMIDECMK